MPTKKIIIASEISISNIDINIIEILFSMIPNSIPTMIALHKTIISELNIGFPLYKVLENLFASKQARNVARVPNTTSIIPKPPNNRLEIKHPIVSATIAQLYSIDNKHNISLNLNCIGPKLIGARIKHKAT